MQTLVPTFRELSRDEIHALLGRNHIGRIAFPAHNSVDVATVPYAYADCWLYGRIAPGMKLAGAAHHPFVAFEVDEVVSPLEWRSAVVRGALYLLQPEGAEPDRHAYERARALLDAVLPAGTGDADATASPALFRIPAYHATGRACEGLPG